MARWIALDNEPGLDVSVLVLLTDASVMAYGFDSPSATTSRWMRLTSDRSGSYARGFWRTVPPMRSARYGPRTTALTLTDGRMLVWGGEEGLGAEGSAEIYDPVRDAWVDVTPTTLDRAFISFWGTSTVLGTGHVLVGSNTGYGRFPPLSNSALYTPWMNRWTEAGRGAGDWFRSWTLLANGSVLRTGGRPLQRFVPSVSGWEPVMSPGPLGGSITPPGPAILLPDGRVWVIFPYSSDWRGHGQTAFYVPGSRSTPERWEPGPDLPEHVYHGDHSSGCLLPDGHVFFQALNHSDGSFAGQLRFYDFDPAAGTYTERVPPGPLTSGDDPNRMPWGRTFASLLLAPDGTVLVSRKGRTYAYDPESPAGPRDEWRPVIHTIDGSRGSVSLRPGRSYTVTGELFAGLSEAHSQPEDAQATNYPLLRIEYEDGQVAYWRTYDISSRAVAAYGATQTFRVTIPPTARLGRARVSVVTNAIPSRVLDAHVENTNRFWVPEVLYREDVRLIGNLADGGFLIIGPGGIQPVGPWDPAVLKRLDTAVEEVRAMALASCADWKRIMQVPQGVEVVVSLRSEEMQRGELVGLDDESLTIAVEGKPNVIRREDVMEVFASAAGFVPGEPIGHEVLVYRHASLTQPPVK